MEQHKKPEMAKSRRKNTNPEEKEFLRGCNQFKDYASIDEYIADIRRWLMLSSYHCSEEEAAKLTENPVRKKWIEESFENKEPAADIAADVGYFCG